MTIKLTPQVLAAAYDFLNATEPFSKWNLPDSEEIAFKVSRDRSLYGFYRRQDKGPTHSIAISVNNVGHTSTLMYAMAHEMIHLHQRRNNLETNAMHNRAFMRDAALVCKVHGFDPKFFC